MRNKAVIALSIICAVLFISALILVLVQNSSKGGDEIEIIVDRETVYNGAGTVKGEPIYIQAVGRLGANLVRIDESGVIVESYCCPNGECAKAGYLKNPYRPIVCIPNNMIIRFRENAESKDDIDAISK